MPSKNKLEERELKKIASAARTKAEIEKKIMKKRAKKNPELAKSQKDKLQKSADLKKKLAVIVTRAEAEEVKTRAPGTGGKAVAADDKKGKKKKFVPKKMVAAAAKASAESVGLEVVASHSDAPAGSQEPPYNFDINVRYKCVFVNVTLHKVPDHCVSLDKCTATEFVLDTGKFTKKFYLRLVYPHGIKVDCGDAADCKLENGILSCRFPILGAIPKAVADDRQKILDKRQKERDARFKITTHGDLVVRARRAVLSPEEKLEKSKAAKADKAAKNDGQKKVGKKRARDGAETENNNDDEQPAKKKVKITTDKKKGAKKDQSGAADESSNPKKAYLGDDAMKKMAEESGNKQHLTTLEKIKKAKEVMSSRNHVQSKKIVKKDTKKDKVASSFERIIAERKSLLARKAALLAPAPKKASKGADKNVKFA